MVNRQNNKTRIAVIGSGFGGLSAAIRLQTAGFEVRIFEKRDMPGGRAYVYHDKGFTFDAGPTVITAPACLEELYTLSGRKLSDYVQLMPVTPFYRLFWEDGYKFDYSNDLTATLNQIEAKSPPDVEGYKKFLRYSQKVFNEGYTKLAHVPFLNWWSMIRVSPQLAKLQAYRSVYSMVASFIKDSHLRQAFSFHSLLVGGNPFSTSSIYTLIHHLERNWGVSFPKGGTGALVRGLVKLFEELGGTIQLNAEVAGIETAKGRSGTTPGSADTDITGVRFKDGSVWECKAVVSNADVVHTYRDLMKDNHQAKAKAAHLGKMRQSMSLFLIYFGTKKRYPNLAHHNVIFGSRYKELLRDIFENGVLPDDFSLYLHAPSVSDPDLAPEGCEAFYVLSPVSHLGKLDIDWKVEGPKYADRILTYLDKHYLPGLKENLVTQRIFTPLDFKQELNAEHGAAFSLEPVLTQSAYFRTHNRDADIKGLYVVGAGTHPGAGVPGVVNSAKATAGLVISDFSQHLKSSRTHSHLATSTGAHVPQHLEL